MGPRPCTEPSRASLLAVRLRSTEYCKRKAKVRRNSNLYLRALRAIKLTLAAFSSSVLPVTGNSTQTPNKESPLTLLNPDHKHMAERPVAHTSDHNQIIVCVVCGGVLD